MEKTRTTIGILTGGGDCPGLNAVIRARKQFGHMVALQPPGTVSVKITDAVGRLRQVPPDGDLIETGRALGISFGD